MTERGDSDLAELDRGCYGEMCIQHQRPEWGYPSPAADLFMTWAGFVFYMLTVAAVIYLWG